MVRFTRTPAGSWSFTIAGPGDFTATGERPELTGPAGAGVAAAILIAQRIMENHQ